MENLPLNGAADHRSAGLMLHCKILISFFDVSFDRKAMWAY